MAQDTAAALVAARSIGALGCVEAGPVDGIKIDSAFFILQVMTTTLTSPAPCDLDLVAPQA